MPPKFPLVAPFSTIRRIYPSPRKYQAILDANPGCILGVISKTGAMEKTVTLTRIGMDFHKTTQKPFITRKDVLIDDPLEETKASDLVLARSLGLISKLKRHAFYKLVHRQGTPADASRTERILAVERERLDGVEQRRRERLARVRQEAEQADQAEA